MRHYYVHMNSINCAFGVKSEKFWGFLTNHLGFFVLYESITEPNNRRDDFADEA